MKKVAESYRMPPPRINLTTPITMTTRLMVDPLLAGLNNPGTKPSTAKGMTNQFSHPSNGMKPTIPIARATRPIMTEKTFIATSLRSRSIPSRTLA